MQRMVGAEGCWGVYGVAQTVGFKWFGTLIHQSLQVTEESAAIADGQSPLADTLCQVPGLQLLILTIRQLVGYRQEMNEADIAAIMSMLKRMLRVCAMGNVVDQLQTVTTLFDLMSMALLEFRFHLGPQDIMDFVLGHHGLDAFKNLKEEGQVLHFLAIPCAVPIFEPCGTSRL